MALGEIHSSATCDLCYQTGQGRMVSLGPAAFVQGSSAEPPAVVTHHIYETELGEMIVTRTGPLPHEPAAGDDTVDMVQRAWQDWRRTWIRTEPVICETCLGRLAGCVGLGDVTAAEARAQEQTERAEDLEAERDQLEQQVAELQQALAASRHARLEAEAAVAVLEAKQAGNGTEAKPAKRAKAAV